jgi:hypothetical protein
MLQGRLLVYWRLFADDVCRCCVDASFRSKQDLPSGGK